MSKSNGECSRTRKKLQKQANFLQDSSNEIDRRIFVLPGKLNSRAQAKITFIFVYFCVISYR